MVFELVRMVIDRMVYEFGRTDRELGQMVPELCRLGLWVETNGSCVSLLGS